MTDVTRYMNAYVDHAVGMIHEYLAQILQLKTQFRMANDIIAEKDSVISSLNLQLEANKASQEEMNSLHDRLAVLEQSNNSLVNQNSHLNTALSQISSMKKEIQEKNSLIEELQLKLNPPKKKINTKNKSEEVTIDKKAEDDF